jgi:hypothetical protein
MNTTGRSAPPCRFSQRYSLAQVAAFALLCLIALDLTHASCDPLLLPLGGTLVSVPPAGPSDACGDGCVPDCFCCSTTVAAAPVVSIQPFRLACDRPAPPAGRPAAGISSVPDHIPIAAA